MRAGRRQPPRRRFAGVGVRTAGLRGAYGLGLTLALLAFATASPLGAQQVARSADGMVVTSHPLATAAGVDMLEAGGNAIDAAVAAAFTLAVVDPAMTGLGGRTQVLLRTADGRVAGVDGTTQVPAGFAPDPDLDTGLGYRAIGVPGTVAALATTLERYGTLPLDRVLRPAIRHAEDGFVLQPHQEMPAAADLSAVSGAPGLFARADGSAYAPGDRFRQPELARTLRAIARGGPDAFYRGEIARRIAADMAAHGGFVTLRDLADYRALESRIVRGSFHDRDLVGTYWPASGATTIEILQILDRVRPSATDDVAWASAVARALLRGFDDRRVDRGSDAATAAWLTSDSLADRRAAEVRDGAPMVPVSTGPEPHESENTTHLSVADRQGNVVAMTQSLGNTFGSRVATDGLGFLYAMTMGYLADEPGSRPGSSQSPLLVLHDDQVELVLGAAGSRRIISAIVETLSRTFDQHRSPVAALAAPRFHPDTAELVLEARPGARWSPTQADALRRLGWAVEPRESATYFGRIHGIWRDPATGEWVGIADPRRRGTAGAPGGD